MRARSLVAALATIILIGLPSRIGHADPKGEVEKKIKEAMDSYDGMDYDAAKKALNQALASAKKSKLDKDTIAARAYVDLGIVAFANSDADGAKGSFLSAVQIDPKIQIDAAYKSPEMSKLLDQARSELHSDAGGGAEPADTGPAVACGSVKGLQHTMIDTAKANTALSVEALVGGDVKHTKVSVMYRPEGSTEFTEVKMTKQGDCKYVGKIPAAGMHGSLVHYYVAAYGENGKPVAAKGSAGSPNIMELTAGGGGTPVKGDDEDPIGGNKKPKTGGGTTAAATPDVSSGGEVDAGSGPVTPKKSRFLLAVSGGTGLGYVTGGTEGGNTVKNCCLGNSLVVLMPELGYYTSPATSISVVLRLGFPLGANVDGHATMAPAGLVRLRHALSATGEGLHVMGQLGVGIVRNTIKLDNNTPGMDTDVVAQGPLLLGGGAGYTKHLSPSIAFLADVSAIAGIAVSKTALGSPALNSGVTADLSLGLAVGF